LGFQHPWF